jgi:hypothetical protein
LVFILPRGHGDQAVVTLRFCLQPYPETHGTEVQIIPGAADYPEPALRILPGAHDKLLRLEGIDQILRAVAGKIQAEKVGGGIIAAVELPDPQGLVRPQGKGKPTAAAAKG